MVRSELVETEGDGKWKMWIPIGEYSYWIHIEVVPAGVSIDGTLFPWKELDIARHRVRGDEPALRRHQ